MSGHSDLEPSRTMLCDSPWMVLIWAMRKAARVGFTKMEGSILLRLRALVVLGLSLSLAAQAEAKKLTLLVTGDNRGEIAPCG
jgi:hypothetical protein